MLVAITWSEYGVIILAAVAVYYTVVMIVYFKNEVLSLRLKKEGCKNNLSSEGNELYQKDKGVYSPSHNDMDDNNSKESRLINESKLATPANQISQPELSTAHLRNTSAVQEIDNTFYQMQEVTAGLKEAIAQAVEKNSIREDFILSLQLLLKKYSFLKSSPFLVVLNNLIASECEKYGYIQLSAEERGMLWNE